jgi:hypothetical protein
MNIEQGVHINLCLSTCVTLLYDTDISSLVHEKLFLALLNTCAWVFICTLLIMYIHSFTEKDPAQFRQEKSRERVNNLFGFKGYSKN